VFGLDLFERTPHGNAGGINMPCDEEFIDNLQN
jgi:hypothetical protein